MNICTNCCKTLMIYLFIDTLFFISSNRHMITAAHCDTPSEKPTWNIRVMVGHLDKKDLINKRNPHLLRKIVGNPVRHPRYKRGKVALEWQDGSMAMETVTQNVAGTIIKHKRPVYADILPIWDIMMVEFEPIKFSRDIQPAMLPGLDCTTRKIQHDQKTTKLLFAGWGDTLPNKWPMARPDRPHWNLPENEHIRLNSTPKYSSNWLQIMHAEILSLEQCRASSTYKDLWRGVYGKGRDTRYGWQDNGWWILEDDEKTQFDFENTIEKNWMCAKGVVNLDKIDHSIGIFDPRNNWEEPIFCTGDSGCK